MNNTYNSIDLSEWTKVGEGHERLFLGLLVKSLI